jgi:hypothetical protein
MSVLFAALIGGFALGQAAPNLQYFAAAKVAGARVVGMIRRSIHTSPAFSVCHNDCELLGHYEETNKHAGLLHRL